LLFLSFVLVTGRSLGDAVFRPINDPLSAKVAEWARVHGMGAIVTGLESLQYRFNPLKVGGVPMSGFLNGQDNSSAHRVVGGVTLQNSLSTVVRPILSGEGKFKAVVRLHGMPVVQVAFRSGPRKAVCGILPQVDS
jgi:hypothetical protein